MSEQVHLLTVAYVGTSYAGWQRQHVAERATVQGALEKVVATIWKREIHVEGSGRTDAGVHARGQTAGFSAPRKLAPEPLRRAMNFHLPADIQVKKVEFREPTFHPRFDVAEKTYEYLLWNTSVFDPFLLNRAWHIPQPLDLDRLREAAALLVGSHDFASFATNSGTPRLSTIRNLRSLEVRRTGPRIRIRATADGFLYHMVRNLTGALVKVGQGRLTVPDLARLLQVRNRDLAPAAAPAFGLYLDRVVYFPLRERRSRAQKRAVRRLKPPEVDE